MIKVLYFLLVFIACTLLFVVYRMANGLDSSIGFLLLGEVAIMAVGVGLTINQLGKNK